MSIQMTQQEIDRREMHRQKRAAIKLLENKIALHNEVGKVMQAELRQITGDFEDWEADIRTGLRS